MKPSTLALAAFLSALALPVMAQENICNTAIEKYGVFADLVPEVQNAGCALPEARHTFHLLGRNGTYYDVKAATQDEARAKLDAKVPEQKAEALDLKFLGQLPDWAFMALFFVVLPAIGLMLVALFLGLLFRITRRAAGF